MPRFFIIAGVVLILIGLIWMAGERLGLGRLPGDIVFERDGVKVYIPLATSLLVSALLSLAFWLFNR